MEKNARRVIEEILGKNQSKIFWDLAINGTRGKRCVFYGTGSNGKTLAINIFKKISYENATLIETNLKPEPDVYTIILECKNRFKGEPLHVFFD